MKKPSDQSDPQSMDREPTYTPYRERWVKITWTPDLESAYQKLKADMQRDQFAHEKTRRYFGLLAITCLGWIAFFHNINPEWLSVFLRIAGLAVVVQYGEWEYKFLTRSSEKRSLLVRLIACRSATHDRHEMVLAKQRTEPPPVWDESRSCGEPFEYMEDELRDLGLIERPNP